MSPTTLEPGHPPTRTLGGASRVALVVAIAHGVNDAYASFLSPLLPRIMGKLGLSIALAATLAMVLSIAASLLQPLAGYLADRYGPKLFVVLGPAISGVFLSMIGLAPSFTILVVLLMMGGIGSAVFHPPAASMATSLDTGQGRGVRLSFFSFGGAIGFAVGPLIAVGLVGRVGLEGLWMAMIPGLIMAAVIYGRLPANGARADATPLPSPGRVFETLRGPLGVVFGISAVGAFVQRVFLTMEPIIAAQAGVSEAMGAVALSVYLGAQAIGTLTGGVLTDRMDRRTLLVGLTLLSVPTHMLALWLPPGSPASLAFAAMAGFLNMAMLPPIVVMAQEILPEGTGVGSGIVMGLAWALGSVGVLGTGILGDLVGPRSAALLSVPVLLIGTLLALHPSLRLHRRPDHAG
ncbi:MAG: MFS transporter [Longimicrobiales bacterium]